PRSPDAHGNLGAVYFALEKFEGARACQEKAIALKPDCPITLTNLGNTLLHIGLGEEAIGLHERAIRLRPDYADAFCNRGMAELTTRQFE
ncbi:tetratricopeptide repeat protein, partial [Salmonella enterica]|uniref:tetratricopeptide repeat protein n=1 Tax=Salmonella enterica TaxID=28901 RepID=UPI003D2733C3